MGNVSRYPCRSIRCALLQTGNSCSYSCKLTHGLESVIGRPACGNSRNNLRESAQNLDSADAGSAGFGKRSSFPTFQVGYGCCPVRDNCLSLEAYVLTK